MTTIPPLGLLDGMSQAELQAALTKAQKAYLDLQMGAKGVEFSYTQGDGAKSVKFTEATTQGLVQLIRQLQQALGKSGARRRPTRFIYR